MNIQKHRLKFDKTLFNGYSIINPWINFTVIVDNNYESVAEIKIRSAIDQYLSSEDYCYGDLIETCLKDVPHISTYHDLGDDSDEYEQIWDDYMRILMC